MILPPEQGRRTDLLKSSSLVSPNNFRGPVSGIRSCHPHPVSSQNINSDSVHYDPSTQVIVSSGSSCHTVDRLTESTEKDRQSPFPSYSLLAPPPPWVHVFSKSCANSSLRTQCAAAASLQVMSPTVFHRRIRRARKKRSSVEFPCHAAIGNVFLLIMVSKSLMLVLDLSLPKTPTPLETIHHSWIIFLNVIGDPWSG